jgi:membrane-bound ClpP family serine protease
MDFIGMPVLQVLLLAIVFFGLLVEIKTGGLGIGALLGVVAAGVFFGSQYVKGLVSFYQIAVFLAGVLCIIIEILLPTVGLLAGVGTAAMLYSVVLALGGDINAIYALLASCVLAAAVFAVIVNRLPSSRLWHKMVLHDQSTSARGYVSAEARPELVGRWGEAFTELRPSGKAMIDGVLVDVVSEGDFIPQGTRLVVVLTQGSRVVVRRQEKS